MFGVVPQRRVSPEGVRRPKFASVPAVVAWLHRKGSCGDSCSDGEASTQFVFGHDGINGVWRQRKKKTVAFTPRCMGCVVRVERGGRSGDDDGSSGINPCDGKHAVFTWRWGMQRWARQVGRP